MMVWTCTIWSIRWVVGSGRIMKEPEVLVGVWWNKIVKHGVGSSSEPTKPGTEAKKKTIATPGPIFASSSTAIPKASVTNKEISLSKFCCFNCQGFGH